MGPSTVGVRVRTEGGGGFRWRSREEGTVRVWNFDLGAVSYLFSFFFLPILIDVMCRELCKSSGAVKL